MPCLAVSTDPAEPRLEGAPPIDSLLKPHRPPERKFRVAGPRWTKSLKSAPDTLPGSDARLILPREILFAQDEIASEVFEIAQGALMVLRHLPGGRRQILDIAGPGRLIGLTAAEKHDCTAIALRDSIVCGIDRTSARLQGARVASAMFSEIHRLRDLATSLGRKTAPERLASFLVAMMVDDAETPDALDLPVSRTEIADHLGLVIETVCRNLRRMSRDGLIELKGAYGLKILDPDALRRIAAGNEAA